MGRQIKTTCVKCNSEVTLEFGEATYSEALKLIDKLDKAPRECPGWHTELGGWKKYWQLTDAVERAYSEDEKDACRDIVRHVIVKLNNNPSENAEHEFKSEKAAGDFVRGLLDGGLSSDSTLTVTCYNAFKEYIGQYTESAKRALAYLDNSYLLY